MFSIRQVESESDRREFHRIQDVIYAQDKSFIKPIIVDIETVFNPIKNPAYEHGEAVRILLYRNNDLAGRAAVFYTGRNKSELAGGIGFFECINDQAAANALFDWAKEWLISKGCTYMDGPVNFGERDSFWGLLAEQHTDISYKENYNPPYYRQLFENAGFEKQYEQNTAEITPQEFDFERFGKLAQRVMSNDRYEFRFLDFGKIEKFADDFVAIYNQAWADFEHFKPIESAAILKLFKTMKPAMEEGMAVFAYADGKPAGFYVNIYELNQLFRKFNGELTFWNKIRFFLNRKRISKTRGVIFGVVPEFHKRGIETGLMFKFYEYLQTRPNLKAAELAWIGDFNPKMMSFLHSLGARTTKIHYTYRKNIR